MNDCTRGCAIKITQLKAENESLKDAAAQARMDRDAACAESARERGESFRLRAAMAEAITDKMRLDFILDGKDAIIHGEMNIPQSHGGFMYLESRADIDDAMLCKP